jgi:hypothetical protein
MYHEIRHIHHWLTRYYVAAQRLYHARCGYPGIADDLSYGDTNADDGVSHRPGARHYINAG